VRQPFGRLSHAERMEQQKYRDLSCPDRFVVQ
jgi:hypothetical protein